MSQPYTHLAQISDSIGNLTEQDLYRLCAIVIKDYPTEAATLVDGLRTQFALLDTILSTEVYHTIED